MEMRSTPGVAETAKARRLGGRRVCLQGDLKPGAERPSGCDAVEDRGGRRGLHQRWRTTAEKHARHRPARRLRREAVQFAKVGVAPAVLVDAFADVAVEIAVGALRSAERPVDVDGQSASLTPSLSRRASPGEGEARGAPVKERQLQPDRQSSLKHAAISLRKASARWLIRCFSSGSISPKVISRPSAMKMGS